VWYFSIRFWSHSDSVVFRKIPHCRNGFRI
jgi:hypothetical protein